jgi:predicted site-specific integrase-resolvase
MTEYVVIGRAEIAHRLGRSQCTISRWIKAGILAVRHAGPGRNSLLVVRVEDLERVRAMFAGQGEAA